MPTLRFKQVEMLDVSVIAGLYTLRIIIASSQTDSGTPCLPGFWWGIMRVIAHIPEPLFRRLRL